MLCVEHQTLYWFFLIIAMQHQSEKCNSNKKGKHTMYLEAWFWREVPDYHLLRKKATKMSYLVHRFFFMGGGHQWPPDTQQTKLNVCCAGEWLIKEPPLPLAQRKGWSTHLYFVNHRYLRCKALQEPWTKVFAICWVSPIPRFLFSWFPDEQELQIETAMFQCCFYKLWFANTTNAYMFGYYIYTGVHPYALSTHIKFTKAPLSAICLNMHGL